MDYTLSAVRLWVSDLERAKDFYTNTIGMPVVGEDLSNGYFMLDTGAVKLLVESRTTAMELMDQLANRRNSCPIHLLLKTLPEYSAS
jgi:catechol 2,3-dioxygenase-like lactoylglutathione lyase family enzyme